MGTTFTRGMDCKLYRAASVLSGKLDSDVTGASWTEIANVRDVDPGLDKDSYDATTRDNDGWKATADGLKDAELTFQMQWKDTDTSRDALRDAYLNNTAIALAVMDRAITTVGTQGLISNFSVTGMSPPQPIGDVVVVTFTCKPSSQTMWWTKGS